jgi:hypothetical protein
MVGTAPGARQAPAVRNRRRFFAIVWRINAILIMVTGVLAAGVLAFAGWQIYKDLARTRHASDVVNVANEQVDRSQVRLGQFVKVEGSQVLRAPLMVEQEYGFRSGTKEATAVRNYLFYDPASGRSHWLLPGNRGLFLETHDLPELDRWEGKKPVVAVVYELVESDTSGDRKLTATDQKVIALSDAAGSRFTRVLTGVEEMNGSVLIGESRLLVLYTSAATLKGAEIDVVTHKVLRDAAVQPGAPEERVN